MRRFDTSEDNSGLAEAGEAELMLREGTVLTDAAWTSLLAQRRRRLIHCDNRSLMPTSKRLVDEGK